MKCALYCASTAVCSEPLVTEMHESHALLISDNWWSTLDPVLETTIVITLYLLSPELVSESRAHMHLA